MSGREKISPSPTSVEPKKSVRLAQKRKLREESGPPNVSEDEYYFTPYQFSKSSSPARGKSQSSRSSSPSTVSSPTIKKMRGKTSNESSGEVSLSSNPTISPVSKVYAPSPKARTLSPIASVVVPVRPSGTSVSEDSNSSPGGSNSSPLKKKLAKASGLSSSKEEVLEEEKWLDALESGKLEELDEELRQMKNPKLLTARQRAIMEKKDRDIYGFNVDDELLELGFLGKEKEKLVITQEMIKLKAEKTEKRRQLAQEKKEIDKKKTMDRLLKKQQSKVLKGIVKPKGQKRVTDYKITLACKADQTVISFPIGYPLPFEDRKPICVPVIVKCGVEGCTNPKKYCCSKTKVPLCSLKCYKKNISLQ
ncbi:unnamed protein product [Allacma fusca]|uniref:INO80 complex subunit B-like conserved region domain-containing protein n=1 Tax=Allacma fusca TaxID=39272 RepID=A0A8J2J4F1_9HEXA|nr:unnamed protein product [Allacma fusca]